MDNGEIRGPACRECGGTGVVSEPGGGCITAGLAKLFVFIGVPVFAVILAFAGYRNLTQADPNVVEVSEVDPAVGASGTRVGSCITDIDSAFRIVACEEPHQAEVFRLVGMVTEGDDPLPNRDDLNAFARANCRTGAQYAGRPLQELGLTTLWLLPDESGWRKGIRVVECLLLRPGHESFTGSLSGG